MSELKKEKPGKAKSQKPETKEVNDLKASLKDKYGLTDIEVDELADTSLTREEIYNNILLKAQSL